MQAPDQALLALIARASDHAGSGYKLAKLLGLPQQHISGWKSGARTCMPHDRARLAGLAGEDATQELVRATLAQTAGTHRGDQLRELLGKSSRRIGEAFALAALLLGSLTYSPPTMGGALYGV
jgi:DNA-binding transcriptional regulator YdaS (Cro superfamily)